MHGADPERGRFRAYLLGAVKHFLSDEADRANALKRGGGQTPLSLDFADGESRCPVAAAPADHDTPERMFERDWALMLLDRVFSRLAAGFAADGKDDEFERLSGFITDVDGRGTYATVAADMGISEGALRMRAHRLRDRYRELLRTEVAETVGDETEVDDELNGLFEALRVP